MFGIKYRSLASIILKSCSGRFYHSTNVIKESQKYILTYFLLHFVKVDYFLFAWKNDRYSLNYANTLKVVRIYSVSTMKSF